MNKKFINRLFEWQNWFHYLLLSGSIFFIHFLTEVFKLESAVMSGNPIYWVNLFSFYALGLFIFDTLIHYIFWILPKPYRWRD